MTNGAVPVERDGDTVVLRVPADSLQREVEVGEGDRVVVRVAVNPAREGALRLSDGAGAACGR